MVPLTLVIVVLVCGLNGADSNDPAEAVDDRASVESSRMDRLERLVMKQADSLEVYRSAMLKLQTAQETELSALKRELHDRDAETYLLKRLLQEQASEMAVQRQQMLQFQQRLEDLEALHQHQREFSPGQDNNTTKLHSPQGRWLMRGPETFIPPQNHVHLRPQLQDSDLSRLGRPHGRVWNKRADDGGPLEVVVSQLSQQVTQMTADIQALKSSSIQPMEVVMSQLSQQVPQMTADIQALKSSSIQHNRDILNAGSSVFVRWGKADCGDSAQLVYSGVVGGSLYTESGAATNYLCLTMSPVFGDPKVNWEAHLYGAEYETNDSHQNKDAVCAVCHAPLSATIMVPGTNVCTPGWRLQYSGYLMAGDNSHVAGSEFVCVDSAMENTVHSDADDNGILFYFTKTRCGSLPCSPYVNDQTVLCAVCSK